MTAAWMHKPLRSGLAEPAIDNYLQAQAARLDQAHVANFRLARTQLGLTVNNQWVDGRMPCIEHARLTRDTERSEVELIVNLPNPPALYSG